MPGSILSLFTPLRLNAVLFGVYDYLLPLMLYCAWSTLAFLDLARAPEHDRARVLRWSATVLLLPLVGAAAYLLTARSELGRPMRLVAVLGGIVVVAAAAALTVVRISY
jgi:hypothetical protein